MWLIVVQNGMHNKTVVGNDGDCGNGCGTDGDNDDHDDGGGDGGGLRRL